MSSAPSTQQVVFVVPPYVHLLDLTEPVQVFYEAVEYGAPYQLRYCSFHNQLISSAGLAMGPVQPFTQLQLQPDDLLFIPGMTMEAIAQQCGFQDARQLRRIWQKDKSRNTTQSLT